MLAIRRRPAGGLDLFERPPFLRKGHLSEIKKIEMSYQLSSNTAVLDALCAHPESPDELSALARSAAHACIPSTHLHP
jgi:hypothetical protein